MDAHESTARDRIIFALDVPTSAEGSKYVNLLDGCVGAFKVGLELFIAAGPAFVGSVARNRSRPVMLDLKLHDIPETVERAVLVAGDLGVKFLTLHVQQRAAMSRAVKAAEKSGMQLLAITLLTSMNDWDCHDLRFNEATSRAGARAGYLAGLAWQEGITGLVTSPQDVAALRTKYPSAVLVCPGVRPDGSTIGDQKRTATPGHAIQNGANYVVVGRPIRDATDPVASARAIAAEIDAVT